MRIPVRALTQFSAQGHRPVQEDHVMVRQERGIFAIADGFGGVACGPEAAQAACEGVRGFLEKEAGDTDATMPFVLRQYFSLAGNVLFNSIIHANRKVLALNKGRSANEKGGASMVAGFVDGDLLALANVGACSAWLFRGGREVELVVPRTYARLCDPFAAVGTTPDQQIPLMALGISDDLEPEIFEYRLKPGDWLFLQTDGLTSEARGKVLALQSRELQPEQAVKEAAEILKDGKYEDNAAGSLIIF
jgi:protein phosphatase